MPESALTPGLLLLTSVGIVSGYFVLQKLGSRLLLLPPGPPSYPLIGQLLSMPRRSEGRAFMDWSRRLNSDIISFSFLGKTIIVLNSVEVANDLLERRSSTHSGRYCPPMIASPNLMNMKDFVAFMDSNELWKKQRRTMSARLNKQAVAVFRGLQELEARRLLVRLLAHAGTVTSDLLNEEFYRATSAIFLESVYGYELKSPQDRFFVDNMKMNANLSKAALPTAFLVNLLPCLEHIPEWVPGAGWKRIAHEWREQKDRTMGEVYEWAKQRIMSGADESSIVALTFKEAQELGWDEASVDAFCKNVATGLLAAGTESSTLAMLWFVLAMALYPEVQEKAQMEIDMIVGSNRLPTVQDRIKLPYIDRVLTETMRWHPSVPLGVPHICTEENEYRGYRIPKGAMIFGHIGATVLDERVYKNPHKFEPDRFLDPTVPMPLVFGWGQRICPGQHFFRETFYLEVVMILATMNIKKCRDENGEEVIPTEETTENGAIARPLSFKVEVTPRSELHAELIRTAA
ncbi:unnamed protein product [Rhizoctonia solani]|uniref:O-methylsterigmatocystin oxidoreductase n=1 Tax=Rhizoctonia solani TaxID=456999 RepID=A0A8H3E1P5_9AGAM|nr:unnamed protein product [Rhizoctonia solani]